eukprot:scaffold10698_cov213-Skeletonema_marinoi.AAC.17
MEASEGGRRSSQLPFGALHCQRKAQLIIVVLTNHEIVLCETIYHVQGYSYTAPTPKVHIQQQLGLLFSDAIALETWTPRRANHPTR